MKVLTCKDLGGPCDAEVSGETFEEMGNSAKVHVMQMIGAGDAAHLEAVEKMRKVTPEEMQTLMAQWKQKFEEGEET